MESHLKNNTIIIYYNLEKTIESLIKLGVYFIKMDILDLELVEKIKNI